MTKEAEASNAGAHLTLRGLIDRARALVDPSWTEWHQHADTALSTPEPQIGERDGEESPYTWVKTQRVPGTSHVGGSLMLLAEDGHCVGIVKVMSGEGATENDVHRALQTAGNPAKLQRFIRAARNGEQEANDRAEAAERRLDEVKEELRIRLENLAREMRAVLRANPTKDGGLYRQRLTEAEETLAILAPKPKVEERV